MGIRDKPKALCVLPVIFDAHYQLTLIFLLAFLLRANGLGFGLPYVFHDDEHQYVEAGIALLQDQQVTLAELQKLNNPPLFKSVLGFLYALYIRVLILNPKEVQAAIDTQLWRTFFQYAGRFASVSGSLLTVALLYALGKRLYGRKTGMLGALLLAVCFLHVRESHFAVNDAPLTLLTVASLYAGAGILRRGRWFDYLMTGFLMGLAAATKYTGILLISGLLLAHWLRWRQANFRWLDRLLSTRLLLSLLVIPVGFAAGAPVALGSWQEMIRRIGRLSEYGRFGYHDLLLDPQGGWIFYLKTLAWGAGWLMLAAFGVAVALTLIYRSPEDLFLLAFPLLLYVMMGRQETFFARFILPALPPLILLMAAWLGRLNRLKWKLSPVLNSHTILITSLLLLVVQPLAMSIWFGTVLNRPDTREIATNWIRANIPEGAIIYADTYAVTRESVTGHVSLPYVQAKQLPFDYPDPVAYYRDRGVQFIITSDYHCEPRYTDSKKETGRERWLAGLSHLKLIQEFQPYWLPGRGFSIEQRYGPAYEVLLRQQPGPIIRVYALDSSPAWHGLNPFTTPNQIPGKVSIFGYEIIPEHEVLPGNTVDVTIYWLNGGWQASDDLVVALVDVAGFEVTRAIAGPASGFEDELDSRGSIVKSVARFPIPAGTPPGVYTVRLSVYDHNKLQSVGSLSIEQENIAIVESLSPASMTGESEPSSASLAPGISLVAYQLAVQDSLMQNTLVVGQDNWMVLSWRPDRNITLDYRVKLTLTDNRGGIVAVWEGQPVHNSYATSNWKTGQLIRDPWNLRLPETVAPGTPYRLALVLLDSEENIVGTKVLGTMLVSSHVRSSAVPAIQHTVGATWGGVFSLLGFDIRAVPDTSNSGYLELDLFWQSIAPTKTDYVVGIRLVNSQGRVVLAQAEQPSGGKVPTSSWQPGEVIQDFHSLHYSDLDWGETYQLETVLLDSQTGAPLPVEKDGKITDSLSIISWP